MSAISLKARGENMFCPFCEQLCLKVPPLKQWSEKQGRRHQQQGHGFAIQLRPEQGNGGKLDQGQGVGGGQLRPEQGDGGKLQQEQLGDGGKLQQEQSGVGGQLLQEQGDAFQLHQEHGQLQQELGLVTQLQQGQGAGGGGGGGPQRVHFYCMLLYGMCMRKRRMH